jgi:hypothetical protein
MLSILDLKNRRGSNFGPTIATKQLAADPAGEKPATMANRSHEQTTSAVPVWPVASRLT